MKRKTKIRVMGQWIKLIHIPDLCDENEQKIWGLCDPDERTITLEANITDETMYKRVLRHEKTHMLLALSGLNQLIPGEVEEALAVLMEINE